MAKYAMASISCPSSALSACLLILALSLTLSGCAPTLRQQYIDASDPCSSAREPIVTAGDELNARYKQLAQQKASQEMQGQELPVVTGTGNQAQFNFGNFFANVLKEASLENQAYLSMKQQETGANAAALLASVEGDASNDRSRLQGVTRAMRSLRECRATQITQIRENSSAPDADKVAQLRSQQTKLDEDDQLIAAVFGDYGKRAQLYQEASASVSEGAGHESGGRGGRHVGRTAAARSSVQAFREDQQSAQIADRKQSETLHETLQSSISGA